MDIIILAVVVFGVLLVGIKGICSAGLSGGHKPEKGKKGLYGIAHFLNCIIQFLNPVTGKPKPFGEFFVGILAPILKSYFWWPNIIWKIWWPDPEKGKTLFRVKFCTVILRIVEYSIIASAIKFRYM